MVNFFFLLLVLDLIDGSWSNGRLLDGKIRRSGPNTFRASLVGNQGLIFKHALLYDDKATTAGLWCSRGGKVSEWMELKLQLQKDGLEFG